MNSSEMGSVARIRAEPHGDEKYARDELTMEVGGSCGCGGQVGEGGRHEAEIRSAVETNGQCDGDHHHWKRHERLGGPFYV